MFQSLWTSALTCRASGGLGYDFADGLLDNAGVCVPRTYDGSVPAATVDCERPGPPRSNAGGSVDCVGEQVSSADLAEGSCSFEQCPEGSAGSACADPAMLMVDNAGRQWREVGCDPGSVCVSSYATMASSGGLAFGIVNIVGNFGTVFIDQSYWQAAIAAQPKATVKGFLIGGLVWFAIPFCMATTFGLAGRALSTRETLSISLKQADAGLVPAIVITDLLGTPGAFALLTMLFMAVTSTGSAEVIAVSSILTYDLLWSYLLPELREGVQANTKRWRTALASAAVADEAALTQQDVAALLAELRQTRWLRDGGAGAGGAAADGLSGIAEGGGAAAAAAAGPIEADELYAALQVAAGGAVRQNLNYLVVSLGLRSA